jgi:hypothetical protein
MANREQLIQALEQAPDDLGQIMLDARNRFEAMALKGNPEEGLNILAKLDAQKT